MNCKVALTVWEGRISPVLDTARSVVLAEVRDSTLISQQTVTMEDQLPQQMLGRLLSLGVGMLVCGAVSRPLADLIQSAGIRLVPFVSGDLGDVLQAVVADKLPDGAFAMPGCGCARRRRRGISCAKPRGSSIRGARTREDNF